LLLTSALVNAVNENSEELGGPKLGLGMQLFSPITGKTPNKMFVGDIDIDVMPEVKAMPNTQEEAAKMLHDAKQEAVNFIIDCKTGQHKTDDGEAFVREFAKELGINLAGIRTHIEDEEDDDAKA
jgi:hypothetical protein